MRNQPRNSYEFDAALSFAGENRKLAEAITRELQTLGRTVFYDRDHTAHLWGKRKKEYERIYGKESRFFVPLLSKHYYRKDWTQLEFSIAKRASRRRKDEYILPVQIDGTLLLGISDDVGYLTSRENTPKQIALAIDEKCQAAAAAAKSVSPPNRNRPIDQKSVEYLVSSSTRRALLLLATAALFHSKNALQRFFPDVDWDESLEMLKQTKLVKERGEVYSVIGSAMTKLREDNKEWLDFHTKWIGVLEPYRSHLDVCACLSLHYLTVDRTDEAATLLVDAVEYGELGRWTNLYLACLRAYADQRWKRRFTGSLWLRVLNGVGLCLAHLKMFGESIDAFMKLKRAAVAADDVHWLGQAYFNLGVASAQAGRQKQALDWYQKAQRHGELNKDFILVSRALGNQSQIVMRFDADAARKLIEQSIAIKRRRKDRMGLATASVQLGELEAGHGNFTAAVHHFESALGDLTKLGMYHDCSVASLHLGNAYLEQGKQSKALKSLLRAKRIATDWEFVDILSVAIGLETRVYYEQKKLDEMRRACGELDALSEKHQLLESKVCAQHSLGIAQMLGGDISGGKRILNNAMEDAKRLNDRKWIERCVVDQCRRVEGGSLTAPESKLLDKSALKLEEQRSWAAAGDVWTRLGHEMQSTGMFEDAIGAYKHAVKWYGRIRDHENKVMAIGSIGECQWQLGKYENHLRSLQQAADVAHDGQLEGLFAKVLGHRAISLQELDQLDAAIQCGQRAIKIERRLNELCPLSTSLHNLGEALRRAQRFEEAVAALVEAESLARSANDIKLAISAAHNRGLAYQDWGKDRIASDHFQSCRGEAERNLIWNEYVRAWEALANLAYCQRKVAAAKNRYRRALSEAQKHGCNESETRVALNYANLLWWEDNPRRAQKVLLTHCNEYARRPDAYMYHFLFAATYEATSDLKAAETHWQSGLRSAENAANLEFTAICAGGLAELYADQKRYRKAEDMFRLALMHEDVTEDKAILMRQLVSVLLEAGEENAASKMFAEAIGFASANNLDEVFVDLYMTVFDHNWRNGVESRFEALKAFVCTFGKAIHMGPDQLIKVVMHFVGILTAKNLAPREEQLEQLRKDLSKWLRGQLPTQLWIHECILFPIFMVERLLPFVGHPGKLESAAAKEFAGFASLIMKSMGHIRK